MPVATADPRSSQPERSRRRRSGSTPNPPRGIVLGALLAAGVAGQASREPPYGRSDARFGDEPISTLPAARAEAVKLTWMLRGAAGAAWQRVESAPLPAAHVYRIRALTREPGDDETSASFVYCGVDARGHGVLGWFTALRRPQATLRLEAAVHLPDTLPFDAAYNPVDARLYLLDGRGDALRVAPWTIGADWPSEMPVALTAREDAALATVDTLAAAGTLPGVRLHRERWWPTPRPEPVPSFWVHERADHRWCLEAELDEDVPDWLVQTQGWEHGAPSVTVTALRASDGFDLVDLGSGAVLASDAVRRGEHATVQLPDQLACAPGRLVRARGEHVGRSAAIALTPRYGRSWRTSEDWVARLDSLEVDTAACRVGDRLQVTSTLLRTKPPSHGNRLPGYLLLTLHGTSLAEDLQGDETRALLAPTAAVAFAQDHSHPRPEVGVSAQTDLPRDPLLAGQILLAQIAILGPHDEVVLSEVVATTIWPDDGPPERLPTAADERTRRRNLPAAGAAFAAWGKRAGADPAAVAAAMARARAALDRR